MSHELILTCDVLHFGQAAVKPVHGLQKLSSVAFSLERRQDQHLAVFGERSETDEGGGEKSRSEQKLKFFDSEIVIMHPCNKSNLICKVVFRYKSHWFVNETKSA